MEMNVNRFKYLDVVNACASLSCVRMMSDFRETRDKRQDKTRDKREETEDKRQDIREKRRP